MSMSFWDKVRSGEDELCLMLLLFLGGSCHRSDMLEWGQDIFL